MAALAGVIQASDPALLRKLLADNPALQSQLDDPLPGHSFDMPALIAAVQKNNREMIDALLAAGANINARTKWWAGSFGVLDGCPLELAPYLIERGARVDAHAAARLGMLDRLQALIETDPTLVHARGGDGQTPLHFAATVEIARYLLDHGAVIDTRDIDHESTPAQYMVGNHSARTGVAAYLVSRGAQTDILMAAALGNLELVRRHLDQDPESVNLSVSERDFPKHNPHSGGSIYIYNFGWSKTPHSIAHERGFDDIYRLLMQRSPAGLQLAQACQVGDETLARNILAREPGIVERLSSDEKRRLVGAALRNQTAAVRLMLECGWPANVPADHAQTPLHWAAWHGNPDMVRELLRHAASLEATEQQYQATPLHWALHGSKNGWHRDTGDYPATVAALLAAGARLPRPVEELNATDEVLEFLRRHANESRPALPVSPRT